MKEQKRVELEMARQLKKPVEDMCLRDQTTLPELERLEHNALPGETLANCLMVLEFCLNFKDALHLGKWFLKRHCPQSSGWVFILIKLL